MRHERLARAGLLLACMALVGWVRLLPLSLAGLEKEGADAAELRRLQAERRYDGADGREHVYLGDLDSYLWLRQARSLLRNGTSCGEVVDGECRDTFTHAPVGRRDRYAGTLHAAAIAAVHAVAAVVNPGQPLPASAYLVPVLVGMLGTVPAFFLGLRLGGLLAAVAAALLVGIDPFLLRRSAGSDNDVWNVVLPLFMVWAAVSALAARSTGRRVALAAGAGVVAALHAATWSGWLFTFAALLGGLAGTVVVRAARLLRGVPGESVRVARSATVAALFLAVAVAALLLVARQGPSWMRPVEIFDSIRQFLAPLAIDEGVRWPDAFASVGELALPTTAQVAEQTSGLALLALAWAGTLVLALPRRWRWWHVAVAAIGAAAAAWCIEADVRGGRLVGVAAAQMLAGALFLALRRDRRSPADDGASLTVSLWFLAALYLSARGARFILLLVAPAGLAASALLGRLHLFLDSLAATALRRRPAAKLVARAALALALASMLVSPARRGIDAARAYLPQMNDAWWQTFTDLAAAAPADAILHTWWDRGYWAAYAGERRVSEDGGSLITHLPYWFGRALMAPDAAESAGIFRMLDCASDALPEPEGERGAYGRLLRHGVEPLQIPPLIAAIAGLDRGQAAARLQERGLDPAARDDVLAATHCRPPPAYLVLSTSMVQQASWRRMGSWDFGKAFAVAAARRFPAGEAASRVEQRLGLDAGAAAELVDAAGAPRSSDEADAFVSPLSVYLLPDWFPCTWSEERRTMHCRIPMNPRRLAEVVYDAEDPAASLVYTQLQPGRRAQETPAVVVVAGAADRSVYEVEEPSLPAVGVLVDVERDRALLASPDLVRSTFTQLVYLDGRTQRQFENVGARETLDGERVTTWRLRWPADGP